VRFDVLVVDDDPDTRANLRDILELDGYEVEEAGTAAEVIARTDWRHVGAILLDRRLPDATADALLPRLRELAPDVAVLVVTGYADVHGAITAFRHGAVDYILKPIDLDEIRVRLGRIADRRRAQEEIRVATAAREQALAELRAKTEELRATTQQLWQAARLAGVGELAASIAHELNNPLGTVSLRIEGVLDRMPADDPRRRPLEIVEQEVARMARLVANLLQFSRPGRDQVSSIQVCDEIVMTFELTSHHLKRRGVAVETDFAPDVPIIFADRQQLRQVFLNLFTNAADAMPAGGRLTPRVRTGELPPARPAIVVEVIDTGTGIPPEDLDRVMDPFFTTKPEGQGTGLGLAICRRIVRKHQGTLEIDSREGEGTTVRITLPIRLDTNVADQHSL
jgi:two-component system, LuxR family, sensor kinase FixL